MLKDKIYPSLSEVEAQFEREDLEQLKAWGDVHNDSQWGVGNMAMKYIDRGLPMVQVLILVGNLTDYSPVAVKKFLACVRFYKANSFLKDNYKQWLRYSIMALAARHSRPLEVLEYALKHNSSPMEIVKLYPITETDEVLITEEKQAPSFFGVEYKAFARWGYGLFRDNAAKKQAFEILLKTFIAHIRELAEQS